MTKFLVLAVALLGIQDDDDEPKLIEEGSFVVKINDQVLGTETYKLTMDLGDYYLEGDADLGAQGKIKNLSFRYTDKFHSRKVSMTREGGQGTMRIKGGFRSGFFAGNLGGRNMQRTAAENNDAIACMASSPFMCWVPVGHRVDLSKVDGKEPQVIPAYFVDQGGLANMKVTVKGKESVSIGDQKLDLTKLAVVMETPAQPGGGGGGVAFEADVFVDDKKRLMKIAIPAQSVEVVRKMDKG